MVTAVIMLFMILPNIRTERQGGNDAEYFQECYQAFIREFPMTKHQGTMEEYLAEARKACP